MSAHDKRYRSEEISPVPGVRHFLELKKSFRVIKGDHCKKVIIVKELIIVKEVISCDVSPVAIFLNKSFPNMTIYHHINTAA